MRQQLSRIHSKTLYLLLVSLSFVLASAASAQGNFTLLTAQNQNNGQAGVSFTIEAINTIKVWRIGANTDGGSQTMEVFYKAGNSAVSATAFATTGWTKAGTTSVAMGTNTNTQIPIDINLIIQQGETYSFVVCCATSTAINYTTGGTGVAMDANIKINGQGWGGGYNSAAGISPSFYPRGYNGAVYYDFAGSKWTGAVSSDWFNPNNWDNNEVPDLDASIIIPDAATTANDCEIPSSAECKGVKIEQGGILNGAGGNLNVYGDWVNEMGIFVPANSTINYTGTEKQVITTGGSTVGNIHIKNTTESITVSDSWDSAQSGTLTADDATHMIFTATALDFGNNTINNAGLFSFGITGGGAASVVQDISADANVNLGIVEVNAADALDSVNFLTAVTFDDLTVSGLGVVTFNGTVVLTRNFETTMEGTLTFLSTIMGDAELHLNSPADLTISGSIQAKAIFHEGAGNLMLGGTTLTGDAHFVSLSPTATATFSGGLDLGGNFDFDPSAVGAAAAVTINGALTVGGSVDLKRGSLSVTGVLNATGDLNVLSNDVISFGVGTSNAAKLYFNCSGSMTIGGSLQTSGVTVLNNGDISIGGNLSIAGDLLDDGLGNFEISGALIANSPNPQTLTVLSTRSVTTGQIRISSGGATMSGNYVATSVGSASPALRVMPGFGLLLDNGAKIELGAPGVGSGWLRVDGSLTTASGASTQRPVIMGQTAATERAQIVFEATSALSLDGIVFDNVGSSTQPFGIQIRPNAAVQAFNYVSILNSASATAAVSIESDKLPKIFQGIEISGIAPANIDATTLSGFKVEIKKNQTGAGSLYGVPFENDPNGVLFWQDPPVVSILSNHVLPNVLAETSFSEVITGSGGNQPLSWSVLNAPIWLSINSITGELRGTPPREAVGLYQFVIFVSDSTTPSLTASKVFTLTVDSLVDVPVEIVTPTLVNGKVGESYSYALAAVGGSGKNFVYELVNPNSLPAGLSLRSDGVIVGMPDAGSSGLYNFAVRVTDSQGNSSVEGFSLSIETEFSNPAIIAGALSDGPGGGGCALGNGSSWLLYAMGLLLMLASLRAVKRQAV